MCVHCISLACYPCRLGGIMTLETRGNPVGWVIMAPHNHPWSRTNLWYIKHPRTSFNPVMGGISDCVSRVPFYETKTRPLHGSFHRTFQLGFDSWLGLCAREFCMPWRDYVNDDQTYETWLRRFLKHPLANLYMSFDIKGHAEQWLRIHLSCVK